MFDFIFKQKAADEMRISDWSSDVCSSDLHASQTRIVMVVRGRLMGGRIEHEDLTGTGAEDVSVAAVESGDLYAAFGHGGFRLVPGQRAARQLSADRKRVVWGKSVVDSVDIGGCRQY